MSETRYARWTGDRITQRP